MFAPIALFPVASRLDQCVNSGVALGCGRKTSPFFIAHGDNDRTVPHNQSELLYAALRRAGVAATLYTVHGADHVSLRATPEQMRRLDVATDAVLSGVLLG